MGSAQRTSACKESIDVALALLAARQHGLISRRQVLTLGATKSIIQRRVSSGRWERVFPAVYRIVGVPPSWEQRLLAACLAVDDDTLASHRAGGRLWTFPGCERSSPEIIVPTTRAPSLPGVIVHRRSDLTRADRTRRLGIPVTTPTRTLIDLAAVLPADAVEEALDDALRRGLTSLRALARRSGELARSGRPGIAVVRTLQQARAELARVPESPFETRLFRVLRRARMPLPVPQYEIHEPAGRFVARVDFAYPDAHIAIEADSYAHHGGRRRFEHDRRRLNRLAVLGWLVIRVTWRQLQREPDAVVALVAAALEGGGLAGGGITGGGITGGGITGGGIAHPPAKPDGQ